MQFTIDKIRVTLDELKKHMQSTVDELTLERTGCVDYKKGHTPPADGWQPYGGEEFIGGEKHYWFRASFKTPKADKNKFFMLRAITGYENEWDAINPQGLLYLNGKMVQGLDTYHTETFLEPDTEYEMYNYFYTASAEKPIHLNMSVVEYDSRIEKLYYDILVPYECCLMTDEDKEDYNTIIPYLVKTVNLIDMRAPLSAEYFDSITAADKYIEKEFYGKVCTPEGKPVVACIGHTHIDVEWIWVRAQTREKIQRSFATAYTLMERYPEYKFTLSQPELYRYLKEEAPEKYAELKKLVKEKRWEPEGSMYLEADTNLSGGEALIRQILFGKRFFKDEFGVDNRVLLLPDVFGYSGALPQILRKSGVDRFVTSKISWNETNMFPYDTFIWQGIDGTEIFSHFITTQDYTLEPSNFTTYGGEISSNRIKGNRKRYQQKQFSSESLCTFGYGDGGGGPTKDHLEHQRRLARGIPGMPVTKIDFLLPHLDRVKASFDKACEDLRERPKWIGEMYLEYHRATYTSMAMVKRGNRKSELLLQKAEAFSFINSLFGGNYDFDTFNKLWRKVLHNQFHDILPGSSIKEVYDGVKKDYDYILSTGKEIADNAMQTLADNVSGSGDTVIFNSLGFPAKGPVCIDGKTAEIISDVPSMGWSAAPEFEQNCDVKLNGLTAENKYYILTLDKSGRIASLFDKRANRQVFTEGAFGNELAVYEDYPRAYDNWEIANYAEQKRYVIDGDAIITPVEDGTRAGFKIEKKYLNSTITQTLWLYSVCERIDVENDVDWHEKHNLLKIAFPLDIHTDGIDCEIQFGNIRRPNNRNTSWEKAKFEISAHKWVDMSEGNYGFALLNDCKFGHSVNENALELTAIKCGSYPNKEADVGKHTFTYSLYPHIGGYREGGVVKQGYILNQPLNVVKRTASGNLPETFSFVSANKENIVVETLKSAESGDGAIIRLYDSQNMKSDVTLTVCDGFKKAYLCDMMENKLEQLTIKDNKIQLNVKNFEILTVKLEK